MTVLFLLASLAESSTKETTHQKERTLRPMDRSHNRYPRRCGGDGESHTPESLQVALQPGQGSKEYTHRWIMCLDPSWMCACTHTHTGKLHTDACPCVSLSSSSLVTECPEACSLAKFAWAARDESS